MSPRLPDGHEGPLEPPSTANLLSEVFGLFELARLPFWAPELLRQRGGDGSPVLVLPGFGAGDASTFVLQAYLQGIGYRAYGWDLGTNSGDVPALLPRVVEKVESLASKCAKPLHLVGWSLGGYLAREAARERPDCVRRVITMGSPVVGGPKYTTAARYFTANGIDVDEIERAVALRDQTPLEVPVTSIFSRSDGVVAWRACVDRVHPDTEHVEVGATHVGLGFSPEVLRIIAQRLASDADETA